MFGGQSESRETALAIPFSKLRHRKSFLSRALPSYFFKSRTVIHSDAHHFKRFFLFVTE